MTRSYVHEQEEGVHISANSVHPGVIMTNIFRERTIVAGTFSSLMIDFMFEKEKTSSPSKYLKTIAGLCMNKNI
jgi:NAD(P)-dependent dehydrogenase (short-subunit alcohol dehydrogenase family)